MAADPEEPACTCGHSEDEHDDLGMCLARGGCRCVCFRTDDGFDEDEPDDGPEELDFEQEETE